MSNQDELYSPAGAPPAEELPTHLAILIGHPDTIPTLVHDLTFAGLATIGAAPLVSPEPELQTEDYLTELILDVIADGQFENVHIVKLPGSGEVSDAYIADRVCEETTVPITIERISATNIDDLRERFLALGLEQVDTTDKPIHVHEEVALLDDEVEIDGLGDALGFFGALLGLDPEDPEPGTLSPPPTLSEALGLGEFSPTPEDTTAPPTPDPDSPTPAQDSEPSQGRKSFLERVLRDSPPASETYPKEYREYLELALDKEQATSDHLRRELSDAREQSKAVARQSDRILSIIEDLLRRL